MVTSYLQALVAGRPVAGWAAPRTADQRRSLAALARRLAAIPIGSLIVDTNPFDLPAPGAGVIATLSARLGPPPSTLPVPLGQVVLSAGPDDSGRWWVTGDISARHRAILNRPGVLSLPDVRYSVGTSSVIIDATGHRELSYGALVAQRTADAELPALNARYGGPRRALIAIVPEADDVPLLVPRPPPVDSSGLTWHGRVVLVEGPWTAWGDPGAQGVVVHELTHVVTERWMTGAPASLAEGLAVEEQDRYLRREGTYLRLDDLAYAYRQDYPTLVRWQQAATGWGLRGGEVELAYADAHAVVHTLLRRHGGLPALRRLAHGFTVLGGPLAFSAAEVRATFRAALGVPFTRVYRETRAWVRSGSWSGLSGSDT